MKMNHDWCVDKYDNDKYDDDDDDDDDDGDDDDVDNNDDDDDDDDINLLRSSFSIRALWSCFSESLNNLH